MEARSRSPQQRSRCYRTHTCVHPDTSNTDSSIFLSKTAASAQSPSRGSSSVAAVAPGLEDQIRSHGMTGPSSSPVRMHGSRVKRGEDTGIASRGPSLSCDVHESCTELAPSQGPTSQPRCLTSHLSWSRARKRWTSEFGKTWDVFALRFGFHLWWPEPRAARRDAPACDPFEPCSDLSFPF